MLRNRIRRGGIDWGGGGGVDRLEEHFHARSTPHDADLARLHFRKADAAEAKVDQLVAEIRLETVPP